jgi:oligopeptide/dipeptide ABC transporter ATP-binding protein
VTQNLLEIKGLVKQFPLAGGQVLSAVNGVSFGIAPGESVGLVGESGSGKSTIGMLITRLLPVTGGQILFAQQDITHLPEHRMRGLRAAIQLVFQDPWAALNPRMTIERALAEPLLLHTTLSAAERQARVRELAARVHLPSASLARFPHELSGGQLQRVAIARAIATQPRLLVLDEPTSSLDLSVRAGVLQVLDEIRKETGFATLLISHDLDTIELMTERLLVLYLGSIVEQGATRDIFAKPVYPYTQTLLSAARPADPAVVLKRHAAHGEIPSPVNLPPGCLFASRCPLAIAACRGATPALRPYAAGHEAACLRIADGGNWLEHRPRAA